jgi:hypothetical protein
MKQFTSLFLLALSIVSIYPEEFVNAQITENLNISATVVSGTNPGDTGGSGGNSGGSGGVFTGVRFLGRAYPLSTVVVLKDGQRVVSTIAGPDAHFEVEINGLSPSSYTFSVLSEDSIGRRSTLFTFPIMITQGVVATISGIFLAPTIDTDKVEVKKGDTVTIFGQTAPNSDVTINVNSLVPHFFEVPSDSGGAYLFNLNTSILEYGDHSAKSKAMYTNEISPFGKFAFFKVGDKTIEKNTEPVYVGADLNQDGNVNIVDFSILAYWYKKTTPPAYIDLNSDGVVTVVDFSIMAYYWTG